MSGRVYIAEYERLLRDTHGTVVAAPQEPPLNEQVVTLDVISIRVMQPFSTRTKFVQISIDPVSACSVAFGGSAIVATTDNQRIGANQIIFKGVQPGGYAAFIANT